MTPIDLLAKCERSLAQAAEFGETFGAFVVLVVPRRARGRTMRVLAGLSGIVVGSTSKEETIVSVKVPDVLRYLVRNLDQIESLAVALMERGVHDEAEHWLAQYVGVRDRLNALAQAT